MRSLLKFPSYLKLLFTGVSLFFALNMADAEMRSFVDLKGRTFRGELVKIEGELVTIQRESDGQTFTVKASLFSKTDVEYFLTHGLAGSGNSASNDSFNPSSIFQIRHVKTVTYQEATGTAPSPLDENLIEAEICITGQPQGEKVEANAYFFRADSYTHISVHTLKKLQRPLSTSEDSSSFPVNQTIKIYFPFPQSTAIDYKWKYLILALGDSKEANAIIFPEGHIADFDFPERMRVRAQDGSHLPPPMGGTDTESPFMHGYGSSPYEIRNIRKALYQPSNLTSYKETLVLSAECRTTTGNDIKKANLYRTAHFFDKERNLLRSVDGSGVHVGDEIIASNIKIDSKDRFFTKSDANKWTPILFPYDTPNSKQKPWTTAILVIGDKRHVTAAIYPQGNVKDFDFREKEWLDK